MKKILITGANSYIGTTFEKYMTNFEGYTIETVDMIDGSWREKDFSGYDTVFHVAGIAHADVGNVSEEIKKKYYKINTDLTIETAQKAKKDGVGQFVFMSSMIVFGSKNKIITANTIPSPDNFYGDSKLQADIGIHKLQSDDFDVVSIRPPMIYGRGSKGNYPKLAKLAKISPVFPACNNKRSMLYVENLCEFVRLIITNGGKGFYYPQNREYVKTSQLVKTIASVKNKKVVLVPFVGGLIRLFSAKIKILNKVFGDLAYDKSMSDYADWSYCISGFEESIEKTEK